MWVSLEVGRLHGSFCCCSMISRPCGVQQPQLRWVQGALATKNPSAHCPPRGPSPVVLFHASPFPSPTLLLLPFPSPGKPSTLSPTLHIPLIHPPTQALPPPGSLLELRLYPQVNSASDCTPPSVLGRCRLWSASWAFNMKDTQGSVALGKRSTALNLSLSVLQELH